MKENNSPQNQEKQNEMNENFSARILMDRADFSLGEYNLYILALYELNRSFLSLFQEKTGISFAYFCPYGIMLTDICNLFS